MRKARTTLATAAALLVSSVALGQQTEAGDRDLQRAVQDAWIDGRLEGAYIFNEHLSAAAIDSGIGTGPSCHFRAIQVVPQMATVSR